MEDTKQIKIGAERLGPLHRNQERNFSLLTRAFDLRMRSANRESIAALHLDIHSRHLPERYLQRFVRHILILNVNGGRYRPDIARLQFRQKMARQHIFAIAVVVQDHWQIEVKIDHSLTTEACDSLFS